MTPFPYTILHHTCPFLLAVRYPLSVRLSLIFVQLASAHIDPFALEVLLHLVDSQPSAVSSGIAFQPPIIPRAHPWLHILPSSTGFQPESSTSSWKGWAASYCYFLSPAPSSVIGMKKCSKSLWTGRYYSTNKNPTVRAIFLNIDLMTTFLYSEMFILKQ